MNPLDTARAKLNDPSLGASSPDEMKALLEATTPVEKRPSRMIKDLVHQIIDITEEFPRETAMDVLYDLLAERASVHADKIWTDADFAGIKTGQ